MFFFSSSFLILDFLAESMVQLARQNFGFAYGWANGFEWNHAYCLFKKTRRLLSFNLRGFFLKSILIFQSFFLGLATMRVNAQQLHAFEVMKQSPGVSIKCKTSWGNVWFEEDHTPWDIVLSEFCQHHLLR